jgi:hypothetical protein
MAGMFGSRNDEREPSVRPEHAGEVTAVITFAAWGT